MALTVLSPAGARDAAPGDAESSDSHRAKTVVPEPRLVRLDPGVWSVGPEILVGWGPVSGTERDDLAERLNLVFAPIGRTWRPAVPGESASLTFSGTGATGEGYVLEVGASGVVIGASGAPGRFYALVTLIQLLPPRARASDPVEVRRLRFSDAPEFSWRGLLLDSSRHFQSVETVEWVLERMALHKLNRFHWHLTDDQGWRLEVPGWPRLTEVGSRREEVDGSVHQGYYTAADVRRIVAFAARRHITIVPEIDLPGHSSAALAAYPELSALDLPRQVPPDWAIADGVLSVGRPSVDRFTSDLLTTLIELFPGPWIHWGGDEVFRNTWMRNTESLEWMRRVQAPTPELALAAFWNDLARRTLAVGKIPVGWDEAALHRPPPGTVVQWWDDPARALQALKDGHSLIASWKETTYLDYPEWEGDGDRAWWMPVQSLESVASQPFWPPGTSESARRLLLGVEATLFTERAPETTVGRKLFPRLALVAELAWRGVPGGVPGWEQRIEAHRERLEAWGVGMPPPVR